MHWHQELRFNYEGPTIVDLQQEVKVIKQLNDAMEYDLKKKKNQFQT